MGGLQSFFVGLGIAVAFLLVFGFVVALTAYEESTPYIEREYPTSLYSRTETCSTACTRMLATHSFQLPDGANRVVADFTVVVNAGGGHVKLTLTNPAGDACYDRTFTANAQSQTEEDSIMCAAMDGIWKFEATQVAFSGVLTTDIVSIGIPPGSL